MDRTHERQLEVKRVETLYGQAVPGMAANLVAASVYSVVLHINDYGTVAVLWLLAVLSILLARFLTLRSFRDQDRDTLVPEVWFRRYGLLLLVNGCLWGFMGAFAIQSHSSGLVFFTIAVLIGMIGGSVATTAVSVPVFLALALPTLLPAAIALMFTESIEQRIFSLLLLVYIGVVTRSVKQLKQVIVQSFFHRYENKRLLGELQTEKQQIQESEAQLRQAFDELDATHRDLVEQRSLVDQERVVSARLRELDRLKDEFLANTSHELRTPLYGITGLAEAMVDGSAGPVSDDVKANLGMIIASGRRLSHLVGDILDFSKMRHDGLELEKRPVDLKSVVDVVLTLSQPLVGSNRLELVNQVPRDLPPVAADENRLQQILHNLVGNAIKFTEEGQIEITAAVEDGQVVTRVSDTGIGIPESDQARIFEAFVQADASMDREFAGTGLGLAVTRQLVELHGGKLWLESTLGEGSTFLFGLPTAAGEAPAVALEPSRQLRPILVPESAEPALSTPLQPSETGVDAEPARILVVDDEPVNRQVLRGYLAIEHYQVTLASGGDQALRLLEEQSFDLMLLDVMMPRVSGYEVCKALRSSHRLAELPVIFLTARSQDSDAVTGMSLGANDYLTKPISKDHLLARVRSHLELLRFHRNLEQRVAEKMAEVKVLEGLLPICAGCKKIRDREDEWHSLETYIASHSEAEFSHGLCPDCVKKYQVLPDGPLGVDSSAS